VFDSWIKGMFEMHAYKMSDKLTREKVIIGLRSKLEEAYEQGDAPGAKDVITALKKQIKDLSRSS
jgi:hypothetical protein